jgi:hypothetical protein
MPKINKPRTLRGDLHQLLFSPKGGIEGLLLKVRQQIVQVSIPDGEADSRMLHRVIGTRIELQAFCDHSPKAKKSTHPLFRLTSLSKLAGKKVRSTHDEALRGTVVAVHFAKHGEPNGVVLESGEFIHTRPAGMKLLNLGVGMDVTARGRLRTTALGTLWMEAREVNRTLLE